MCWHSFDLQFLLGPTGGWCAWLLLLNWGTQRSKTSWQSTCTSRACYGSFSTSLALYDTFIFCLYVFPRLPLLSQPVFFCLEWVVRWFYWRWLDHPIAAETEVLFLCSTILCHFTSNSPQFTSCFYFICLFVCFVFRCLFGGVRRFSILFRGVWRFVFV